jgi:hypothetical protein
MKRKMSHGGGGAEKCLVLFEWPLYVIKRPSLMAKNEIISVVQRKKFGIIGSCSSKVFVLFAGTRTGHN